MKRRAMVTLYLSHDLLDAIDQDLQDGKAKSRNALLNSILSAHYDKPLDLREYAKTTGRVVRHVNDPLKKYPSSLHIFPPKPGYLEHKGYWVPSDDKWRMVREETQAELKELEKSQRS